MYFNFDKCYERLQRGISIGLIFEAAAAAGDLILLIVNAKTIRAVARFQRPDVRAISLHPQNIPKF